MFFLRANYSHPVFRQAAREMLPAATGIAAWGLMTGVAMVKSGMSVVEALAMTFLVYAGSSQLAAIPLIVAGAPFWVILATGFCVNLRFVVFSLHLRPYLMHLPRWRRLVNGFLTADMSYAMFTRRYPQPGRTVAERQEQEAFLAGNYFVTWASWMATSVVGILLGNLIPSSWGLGFAGVLCLVGILCSLANTPLRRLAAVVAGAAAVAAYALPLKLNIVAAIAVAVAVSFWLEKKAPPAWRQVA
ncbi:AzlC family ABC transporter permease [Ramlibacter solisilvae]|uniref:Branched-chain amino acid ABC transporter permease n=1 Tax=Ramlibacter tataouinensis TaxID=94132 RepID=A0A127JSX5_9BURK|nr:AzlC family ABC transporter permease [Ramlibacter tataouinensis]AMO23091.1 branched-chain amino acid ABC transporter permease [Ramlibacter tataouinensis]